MSTQRASHLTRSARPTFLPIACALIISALFVSACTVKTDNNSSSTLPGVTGAPNGAVIVDVVVSSEKIALLTDLAKTFNEDAARSTVDTPSGKKRVAMRVARKASGAAATLLSTDWPEDSEGPRPVVWSPSASSWGAIVNQRLSVAGRPALAPVDAKPFMLTPLVIAMPKPMADALGYPKTPVGFADIISLSKDPAGWGAKGHPEWGPFRLGKTNPNFSTSGLSATVAQYYAATGKTSGLSLEDLAKPDVVQFSKDVENAVVHYGDITMTFLNNWFRADARGTSLTYASAVAVEEKSVIDYNAGNPDGELSAGETPRIPRVALVAVYPKEGTVYSDNPFYILDADWVDETERAGALAFEKFVLEPANQQRVLQFGFRPGNPEVSVGPPIVIANGVDPAQPQTTLEVPAPGVLDRLLQDWSQNRKGARVLFMVDVSGSMAEPAGTNVSETKLDLAIRALISGLDEFKGDDQLALSSFTSDDVGELVVRDLVPFGAASAVREPMANAIRNLIPDSGTPLYQATQSAVESVRAGLDPTRINAVVLLTDGQQGDGNQNDDSQQLRDLLASLRQGSEGKLQASVRVFTIAYGAGADSSTLRTIAEATNAAAYDASDPKSIEKVITNVVSNF